MKCFICDDEIIEGAPHEIYPELRFEIDNGITLCERCHKELHRRKVK